MTYQTNTKQIKLDNDKLEQDFGENKNYLNDQHYNNINNNITANNTRNYHHIHNDNNQSLSKLRSLTVLETGLLKNANNKYSPEVINRILIDIGNNLNHVVDVEKSCCSSGSINKNKRYKLNNNKYQFSPKRKRGYTTVISPLLAQQKIVVVNIDIPLNIHNKFNNERKNITTTIMIKVKSNSVQCQTDDDIESKLSKIPNTKNQCD